MSRILRCDQCGRECPEETTDRLWLTVSSRLEFDFCGFACLAKWAANVERTALMQHYDERCGEKPESEQTERSDNAVYEASHSGSTS